MVEALLRAVGALSVHAAAEVIKRRKPIDELIVALVWMRGGRINS
jgi:hypothetical protein